MRRAPHEAAVSEAGARRGRRQMGWPTVAIRRIGADKLFVTMAWFVILAATTVLSASVMYRDAVAQAGLQRVLDMAGPTEANLQVTISPVKPDAVEATDALTGGLISDALGPASGQIARSGRSDSYRLANGSTAGDGRLTVFAFADGIEEHAHLIRGAWPAEGSVDIQTAVSAPAAARLGVDVGDALTVVSPLDADRRLHVAIVGVFEVADPADPFWWADPLELGGVQEVGGFVTVGPLIVGRETWRTRTVALLATLRWRAIPALEAIDPAQIDRVRGGVAGLPGRIKAFLGQTASADVATDLPAILSRARTGLVASTTGVLLLDAQIVILAGYALVLVAALLVERRRAANALLHARGASAGHVLRLAAGEAVVLVVPAALLGPVVAVALLRSIDRLVPVAAIGHSLEPRLSESALLLAGAAAVACFVGMVLPTIVSVGPIASIRRTIGRQLQGTILRRSGVDLALLLFAGIALWQLRANGGPLSRSFRGAIGVDPLLVAAPAIGLLAGALVAMRVVPLLGAGLERMSVRRAGFLAAIATREIARRPVRYSRLALLVTVATAIVYFAGTYGRSWADSQRDQVAFELPADVWASVGNPSADPVWAAPSIFRSVPRVVQATPLVRSQFDVTASGRGGTLLALVSEQASAMGTFRSDLADRPMAQTLGALAADRPAVMGIALPASAQHLRISVRLDLRAQGDGTTVGPPVGISAGRRGLAVALVARDASGQIQRFAGALGTLTWGVVQQLEVPLTAPLSDGTQLLPDAPLALIAIELGVTLSGSTVAAGTIDLLALATSPGPVGSEWSPLDLAGGLEGWGAARTTFGHPSAAMAGAPGSRTRIVVDVSAPIVGPLEEVFAWRAPGLDAPGTALAAIVNDRLSSATATVVGDVLPLRHGFEVHPIRIVGTVHDFPSLPTGDGVAIVDLPTLALAQYALDGSLLAPTEWWFGLDDPADTTAVEALSSSPYPLREIRSRAVETTARIGDPIALGVLGALALAALAAALFALIGFVISTAAASRERSGEFALARAFGISSRQLVAWLALENAFLLVVGIGGGLLLGAVLAWVVLPSVTLSPSGGAAFPPARVADAWDLAAAAGLLGAGALSIAVLAVRRVIRRTGVAERLRAGDD